MSRNSAPALVLALSAALSLVLTALVPCTPAQASEVVNPEWARSAYTWNPTHLAAVSTGTDLGQAGGYHTDHEVLQGTGRYGVPAANWSEAQCTTTWTRDNELHMIDACESGAEGYTLTWQAYDPTTRTVRLVKRWSAPHGEYVLPKFGGVFVEYGVLYLLTGRDNWEENESTRVIALASWNLVYDGSVYPAVTMGWRASQLRGGNDRVASNVFAYGASDLTVDPEIRRVHIHTNFAIMPSSYENVPFSVTLSTGPSGIWAQAPRQLRPFEYSYRQFADMAGPNQLVVADHGRDVSVNDSRVAVTKEDSSTPTPTVVSAKMLSTVNNGIGYTGVTVGDMKVIDGIAYVVGRSAPQPDHDYEGLTDPNLVSKGGQKTSNVYVSATDVSGSTIASGRFSWLTKNPPATSAWVVHEPTITDVNGTAVVLRGETNAETGENRTYYHVLNREGKRLISQRLSIPFLPAAAPVLIGDSLFWVGSPVPGPNGYKNQQVFSLKLNMDELTSAPVIERLPDIEFEAPDPVIQGDIQVGQELRLDVGTWTPTPGQLDIKWTVDGTVVSTDATYTPTAEDRGKKLSVSVTGSREFHTTATRTTGPFTVRGIPFRQAPEPLHDRLPAVGQVSSAVVPDWFPAYEGTPQLQWRIDGVDIPGATGSTYTPGPDELGKHLSVAMTASRLGYEPTTVESAQALIRLGTLDLIHAWTPPANARVGQAVEVTGGEWSAPDAVKSCEWKVDGASAATGNCRFTPGGDHVGKSLSVLVKAEAVGYNQWVGDAESVIGKVQPGWFFQMPAPTMPATVQVGTEIRPTIPNWVPKQDRFTYQWTRDGQAIPGATGASYTPTMDDVDAQIRLSVTGERAGYITETMVSSSRVVPRLPITWTTQPSIVGDARIRSTVTADPGAVDAAGATFTYQWLVDGVAVPDATEPQLVLRDEWGYKRLSVRVTASADRFQDAVQTIGDEQIRLLWFTTKSAPKFDGTPVVGQPFVARIEGWVPEPDRVEFIWSVDRVRVEGVTGDTFVPTEDHVGKRITAQPCGYKELYDPTFACTDSLTSEPVMGAGPKVFDEPTPPRIVGERRVGEILSVDVGSWNPEPDSFTYEWLMGDRVISREPSLRLGGSMLGEDIDVIVTAHKVGYTSARTKPARVSNVGLPIGQRLSGSSRVETAAKISQTGHPGTKGGTVVIATGWAFPDALSATPFAVKKNAPMLLVSKTELPEVTRKEIERLEPKEIIVIGGTVAISDDVESQLRGLAPTVRRIKGTSRFETSALIAREGWGKNSGWKGNEAFIVTGHDFPDGLSAGAAAGVEDMPVILVDGKAVAATQADRALLSELGITAVHVTGGEQVVSRGVAGSLGLGVSHTRYAGKSRYETSAMIADAFHRQHRSVYVANGSAFPDGLAGGVLAGAKDSMLLLSQKQCIPQAANTHMLTASKPSSVFMLGGTVVLGGQTLTHTVCK